MVVENTHNISSKEPRPVLAGVLAVLVHLVFIAVLVFGFNWKDRTPESMTVDLWPALPQPAQKMSSELPKKQTRPQPQPDPTSEPEVPPKPEQTEPAPIQAAPPPPKKPDIELKEKAEQPKPVQKSPEPDPELEKKKAQEQAAKERAEAERLKQEQEAKKQRELKEKKRQELEAQQQREQAEKDRIAAQQAAARAQTANEINRYKAMILAKIKSRIVMPPDLPGNPVVEFNVTLLPGGDILNVRLRKSSGYSSFDSAVERAIFMSKPLPLPPNPALFNEFRNLNVTVHYLE